MEINKYFFSLLLSVCIAAVSQIFLKKSAVKEHTSIIKEYINPYVITGYGLLALSTVLTVFAFTGIDYKNGPVIETLGYIFVMLSGRFLFHERLTKRKVIGNLLILAGIFIYYS